MNIKKKSVKAEYGDSLMHITNSRDSLAIQKDRHDWESIILRPEEWRQKRALRFQELIRQGESEIETCLFCAHNKHMQKSKYIHIYMKT